MEDSETIYGFDYEYGHYSNYTYDNVTPHEEKVAFKTHKSCFTEVSCVSLMVVNVVIFLLGVCGNGVVIWIAGLKMKKMVNTTWYLSLAVSDVIFFACLHFNIYTVTKEWIFGLFMCKFTSFDIPEHDHCTIFKAFVLVVLAWVAYVALSIPSLVFSDAKTHVGKSMCFNNYTDQHSHKTIAGGSSGGLCSHSSSSSVTVIILQLRTNRMMSKPFEVDCPDSLIATFFICWLPYHVFVLLELIHQSYDLEVIRAGLMVGNTVATANNFLNPILSIVSKMENAMGEEGCTTSHYLSRWHNKCFTKYPSQNSHLTVAVSRFVSGFVLPLLIIFCYSVIILGLRTNRMTRSSKAFRVMTALIATFFISWLPCHVFINLEPDIKII
ncbi:unnamed protein product [Coregonus sp. 'balchen']|nr:unnamed protein product [Coregonus sp. 'balchen']